MCQQFPFSSTTLLPNRATKAAVAVIDVPHLDPVIGNYIRGANEQPREGEPADGMTRALTEWSSDRRRHSTLTCTVCHGERWRWLRVLC